MTIFNGLDLAKESQKSPASAGLSFSEQTIAALASGRGGAVAMIRVSGSDSFRVLAACTKLRSQIPWRTMQLASFVDPQDGAAIDELMFCAFQGPNSFTGEDTVELFCHGGPYLVQRILKALYAQGCRPAEPGEFTRRAFLNGKLDLTAAEGVRQLVEASSHQQWLAARQLATGALYTFIEELRVELIGAMAYLEARIDFPDEGDTQDVALEDVAERVRRVAVKIQRVLARYDSGRIASSGLRVAIIGAPNMGKSSLLNLLLDQERAIVTDIAGTTRDYIEESCLVKGRYIRLIDTAGMRNTSETVERIGVEQAVSLARSADLVLALTSADASAAEQEYFHTIVASLDPDRCLQIVNKIELLTELPDQPGSLYISCHKRLGIDALTAAIAQRVDDSIAQLEEEPFVTSARHKKALQDSQSFLESFFDGINTGLYEEMLAFELQNVVRCLEAVIGNVDHDDLLDRIFSEFCVGK